MKIKSDRKIPGVLPALVAAAIVGGCADIDWTRGVYEGSRLRQKAPAVPDPGQARQPAPDYEQYRRERDGLRKSSSAPNDASAAHAATAPAIAPAHRA